MVELIVTLAIFSVVMVGVYAIYLAQIRHSTREYMLAESEMEIEIAKNIIERDIMMAGYGLADDYGSLPVNPLQISSTDSASPSSSDSLTLRATGIGILSRCTMGWSYITSKGPPARFQAWNDGRENVGQDDRVVYIEPNTREILTDAGGKAIFTAPDAPSAATEGTLVYGLHSDSANLPYYTVQYLVGGTSLSMCAPGTKALLRAESRNDDPPSSANREPILNCVRDFQVAFALDTNDDGVIDLWDNGATLPSYDRKALKRRVKQVRLYILLQQGNRDTDFTYSNPDSPGGALIRVGDSSIGTGRDIALTAQQRRYRWRVLVLSVTPRNLR